MNAKEIIQAAARDIGISAPAAPLAATDVLGMQLVALLNKEGRELSRRYPWQALCKEYTFVTVAAESQGTFAALVADMRYPVNETFWNRSTQEPINGPLSPQAWQEIKARVNSDPYTSYRFRGNEILMSPAPTAGQTCALEVVRKSWCTDVTGVTFRNALAVDTDLMLLDDEIMLLGLIWRWKKAKGFKYDDVKSEYDRDIAEATTRDGGKRRLSLNLGGDGMAEVRTAIPRRIGI